MLLPKRFPLSFDELWSLPCEDVQKLGLRHWPQVLSKSKPVYYVKLNCTCKSAQT